MRSYSASALAPYRLTNGHSWHINLGAVRTRVQGNHDRLGTWGIGYEVSLLDRLQLTVETFGEKHSRPDKAIGLRYEIIDGFKVSGAVGRGNDRGFGQVGFAWEF